MRRWASAAAAILLIALAPVRALAEDALAYSGLFLPGGDAVVGWSDGSVTRSPAAGGGPSTLLLLDAGRGVFALAASADGGRIAAASRSSVEVVEAATGRLLLRERVDFAPEGLFMSPDGARLLVRGDDASVLFDVSAGHRIAALTGGDGRFPGFVGGLALTKAEGGLQVWTAAGARMAEIDLGVFYSAVETPGGRLLASTSRGMRVVDLAAGRATAEGGRDAGPRLLVRLAPDRILGLDRGAWRLFGDAGGVVQASRPAAEGGLSPAFRTGPAAFLRWRDEGVAEVFDAVTGARRDAVRLSASARPFDVSADGRRALIRAAGGVARIYDLASGRQTDCLALADAAARCAVSAALTAWEAAPDADRAQALIESVQAAHPASPRILEYSDAQAYLAAARLLRAQDDTASARVALEWALSAADADTVRAAQLDLAGIFLSESDPVRAITLLTPLTAAMRGDPESVRYDCPLCQALDLLSQAQAARGQFEAARRASVEAVRKAPRTIDPAIAARLRTDYAAALEGLGRRIEAETLRARLLQSDDEAAQPTDVAAARQLLAIAESLAERNQRARADVLARDATAVLADTLDAAHPDVLDAEARLGALRLAAQEPARAMEPLRAAASALAAAGPRTSKGRYDRFRSVFRMQVAAAWRLAAATPTSAAPAGATPASAVRHRAAVSSLAVSRDGALLASGDETGQAIVWRIADGTVVSAFGFDRAVRGLAFAADGRALAVGLEGGEALQVRPLALQATAPRTVSLPRPLVVAGRTAAAYGRDGKALGPLGGQARRTAVSADGRVAVSALDDGRTCVATLPAGLPGQCRRLSETPPRAIAIAADGATVLTADGFGPVRRLDARTLETVRETPLDQAEQAESAAISEDGTVAAIGSIQGQIRILDWAAGRERTELEAHVGRVGQLLFLADGRLVSGGADGRVVLWDLGQPAAVAAFGSASYGAGHTGQVIGVDISPDGARVVTTGVDRTLRLWDAAGGAQLRLVRLDSDAARARFLDAGRVAVAGPTLQVRDFDTGTAGPARRNGNWSVVAWSVAGRPLLADGVEKRIDVARADGAAVTASLPVAAEQAADGADAAVTVDQGGAVALWDVGSGRLVARLVERGGRDVGLVGDTVFVNAADALRRFDARTGAALPDADGAGCPGRALAGRAFSYGSASGSGLFVLWGVSGLCVFDSEGHARKPLDATQFRTAISHAAVSPDGRMVSVGLLDGGLVVADTQSGAVLWRLEGHTGEIVAQAFSADGGRLVTGAKDGVARVWDLRRGVETAVLGE